MHQVNISQIVYKHLFPRPRPNDPSSFSAHITRNLVPEVRVETATFYGGVDCIEAQYPGLDYAHAPHRRRLSRFPWHRRLFRAFDELGLTRAEILSICQWEGTKSAKDKYERDAGQLIRDTTADGIAIASRPNSPIAEVHPDAFVTPRGLNIVKDVMLHGASGYHNSSESVGEDSDLEDGDESQHIESYGVELNRRLLAAAEARARGDTVIFDEQWEQWLKEALERNGEGVESIMDQMRGRMAAQPRTDSPGRVHSTAFDNNNLAAVSARRHNATDEHIARMTSSSLALSVAPTAAASNSTAGAA